MYPWGNTLDVTRNVESALETLRPALGDIEMDPTIFRPATFIETALNNLSHALIIGCLLVVIILAAFLFDWRAALISALATCAAPRCTMMPVPTAKPSRARMMDNRFKTNHGLCVGAWLYTTTAGCGYRKGRFDFGTQP